MHFSKPQVNGQLLPNTKPKIMPYLPLSGRDEITTAEKLTSLPKERKLLAQGHTAAWLPRPHTIPLYPNA